MRDTRVFVTGGTGFIGGVVVEALSAAGAVVTVLTRSAAGKSVPDGVRLHEGDMKRPDSYRAAAAGHDVLVHLAFEYSDDTVDADGIALDTLFDAAAGGTVRQVIYTSGLWVLGETGDGPAGDDAPTDRPAPLVRWRVPRERQVVQAGGDGLTTSVVRPGTVYGGNGGLTAAMFKSSVRAGAATVVGDGANRWSMIHRNDLAALYRLVIEKDAGGIINAVDGSPTPLRDVAAAANRAAGGDGSVQAMPLETARQKLGPVADALVLDQVLAAPRARALGWAPACPSFVACAPRAFAEWKAATA